MKKAITVFIFALVALFILYIIYMCYFGSILNFSSDYKVFNEKNKEQKIKIVESHSNILYLYFPEQEVDNYKILGINIEEKQVYFLGYPIKTLNLFNKYLYLFEDELKQASSDVVINDEINNYIKDFCITKDTIEFETFKLDKADYKKYGKKIKIIRQKK